MPNCCVCGERQKHFEIWYKGKFYCSNQCFMKANPDEGFKKVEKLKNDFEKQGGENNAR